MRPITAILLATLTASGCTTIVIEQPGTTTLEMSTGEPAGSTSAETSTGGEGSTSTGDGSSTTEAATSGGTSSTGEETGTSSASEASTGEGSTTGESSSSSTGGASTGAPAPFCGDGFIDDVETCDDGNDVVGDGCDPDCTPSVFVLDGFAFGIDIGLIKGWSTCFDSASDPGDTTWDEVMKYCLDAPGASSLLMACMVEGNDTPTADIVAAGPLKTIWTKAWDPPVMIGNAWWYYQGIKSPGRFGAINGPDPTKAAKRVMLKWGTTAPRYLHTSNCGEYAGDAAARLLIYRR